MKICFLANMNSIHSKKWIYYFLGKGHSISLISIPTKDKISLKDVYFIKEFKYKIFSIVTNIFYVKKIIQKISPDIIHAHYGGVNGALAALSGFHPFVLTVWGSDIMINPKKNLLTKLITKYTLNKSDLITCDAEHTKKAMINFGINAFKIKVIFFGVDTKKFFPSRKDENLQKILDINTNFNVVISSRRLEPICDVETFIKAIPFVLKNFSNTIFIVAGNGSQERELKNLANNLGISEKIRFVGWVPEEAMPKYLNIADIYVSTSLSDGGLSGSTAEAMSCGLPAIITDFGNNRDWIKDGTGGFLIPLKNPEVLAKKISCLIENKDLRIKFGENNRKVIEEKNNYYKEMEKMEEIYNSYV